MRRKQRARGRAPAEMLGAPDAPDVRYYSNGEITVAWKPGVCMHSAVCFRGLPRVFDPRRRPWIATDAAPTQAIVAQVRRCPSGALSIFPARRRRPTETAGPG